MAYLTRTQILNADDMKTVEVEVPEWGGTVVIKGMTGTERDLFEASVVEQKKSGAVVKYDNIRAKLCSCTIIDPETKERMFSPADIEALGAKSASALDRVFSQAQKLSKISDEDVSKLEKN